jgi:hypothetical protein
MAVTRILYALEMKPIFSPAYTVRVIALTLSEDGPSSNVSKVLPCSAFQTCRAFSGRPSVAAQHTKPLLALESEKMCGGQRPWTECDEGASMIQMIPNASTVRVAHLATSTSDSSSNSSATSHPSVSSSAAQQRGTMPALQPNENRGVKSCWAESDEADEFKMIPDAARVQVVHSEPSAIDIFSSWFESRDSEDVETVDATVHAFSPPQNGFDTFLGRGTGVSTIPSALLACRYIRAKYNHVGLGTPVTHHAAAAREFQSDEGIANSSSCCPASGGPDDLATVELTANYIDPPHTGIYCFGGPEVAYTILRDLNRPWGFVDDGRIVFAGAVVSALHQTPAAEDRSLLCPPDVHWTHPALKSQGLMLLLSSPAKAPTLERAHVNSSVVGTELWQDARGDCEPKEDQPARLETLVSGREYCRLC